MKNAMLLIVQCFNELYYCILEDAEPEFMIMIWLLRYVNENFYLFSLFCFYVQEANMEDKFFN